jgi:hypothetical protein
MPQFAGVVLEKPGCLRPRLSAAIGNRSEAGNRVHRADAHYRVNCWPVRPVLDPGTGDLLRRGRGTDLDQPPPAPA